MDLDEIADMQAVKDNLMRNEGQYLDDAESAPNSDEVAPYPY